MSILSQLARRELYVIKQAIQEEQDALPQHRIINTQTAQSLKTHLNQKKRPETYQQHTADSIIQQSEKEIVEIMQHTKKTFFIGL